jgi:DNA topoisomerase-1
MRLVVVESPNKTAKIREFLGAGYRVLASFGHVRDLPPSGGLAVRFQNGRVLPDYVPLEKAGQAIRALRSAAESAEEVLLATDPDREGEAIAWHVQELLGRPCRRVSFQAITKAAVQAAIAKPRAVDENLVAAQQARRVLDRVVGWLVSPTLWNVGKGAKSAGRVQSVALRFVAEREREIQAFKVVDYFTLVASLHKEGVTPAFRAELVRWKGEALGQRLVDQGIADGTVAWCRKQAWQVLACERKEVTKPPPPPFTTATVQQAASVRLKLAPDQTMKLLQALFEGGHITYHRTDSVHVEPEGVAAARALIAAKFPKAYLPALPVVHGQKNSNAQEAHEAIRPTHPEAEPHLNASEAALYRLIHERFLACQMASGRDAVTTLDVACAPTAFQGGPMGVFQAKGVQVRFDGWRRLSGNDATEEKTESAKKTRRRKADAAADEGAQVDVSGDEPRKNRKKKTGAPGTDGEDQGALDPSAPLPDLEAGDLLVLDDLAARRKHTKPPPRYTQASLIKKLEREGIGRPSTYAATLKTLFDRTYVTEEARMLHATDLGLRVTDYLKARYAGNFIEIAYTANLEKTLDAIAEGRTDWQATVTAEAFAVRNLALKAGLRTDPLAE